MSHEDENEDPVLAGLPDDTPDEISSWITANAVADNYTVMLKEFVDGSTKPVYIKGYTNRCPPILEIGKEWGPGKYRLVFSWRGLGISGKKEQITKDMDVELPDRAWRDIHEEFQDEKRRIRNAKKTREYEDEALKNKVQGVNQAPPQVSELDVIKKALDAARSLGVNIGGKAAEKPQRTFTEKMMDAVPLITALGAVASPILVAFIQRPREKDDKTMLNTLLTHALNKPPADDPNKMVLPFLLSSITQIMDLKERMEPQEKETLVERIIGKLAPIVPAVVAMAAQGRAAVEGNPIVQQVRKSEDFKNLAGDVDALILFVNKQDAAYGFQQTNQILMVGGLERPAETLPNMAKFPSKGFKPDGAVDDGRDVKPPDAKPGEPSDETIE